MKNEILFIGPAAKEGGPAIKNRILLKYLKRHSKVEIRNTYDRTLKARLAAVLSILFTRHRYVIVSVSRKGRLLLYPFLLLRKKSGGIRYACIVIGGKAIESLRNPLCIGALKNADIVTAETKSLSKQLREEFALNNVHWMPNYKELPGTKSGEFFDEKGTEAPAGGKGKNERKDSEKRFERQKLRFLFLSRMTDAKGVPTLLKSFKKVLESGFDASLDFYGPVDKGLDPRVLEEIMQTEGADYRGSAPNDQVLKIMEDHDVFVFPTEYPWEGFPAVLVEALAAGLPIIASDMNYNPEIIRNGRNGWIFERGNEEQLLGLLRHCIENREELCRVSENNVHDSGEYNAENVINLFLKKLRINGWPV